MKNTLIDRRIKELEKELAEVHGSIRTLAKKPPKARVAEAPKVVEMPAPVAVTPVAVAEMPPPKPLAPMPRPDPAGVDANLRGRNDRFVDYLASSLGPAQPLRRERNAERNRALVAIGFALLLLFWIISRFLFF